MKKFLSMVGEFPSTIVFWEADRLQDRPWQCAPLSFLHKQACVGMLAPKPKGRITPRGLLCRHLGIRLHPTTRSEIRSGFGILRLRRTEPTSLSPNGSLFQYRSSWENVRLRPSNVSHSKDTNWCTYLDGRYERLALILADMSRLEGILVNVIKEYDKTAYVHYLSNVVRVKEDDEPKFPKSYVDAGGLFLETWCIGSCVELTFCSITDQLLDGSHHQLCATKPPSALSFDITQLMLSCLTSVAASPRIYHPAHSPQAGCHQSPTPGPA